MDDIIEAWVRTVRSGRVRHQCGSAEKHYRVADLDILGELQPYPEASAPPNVRLGWACEVAWRSIDGPMGVNYRLLLSWHYIKNRALAEACRRARLDRGHAGVQQKHLAMARKALIGQLTITSRKPIIAGN